MTEKDESRQERRPCVHVTYEIERGDTVQTRELPFVVGVLADLSGHPETPPLKLADRRFIGISSDNFDAVVRAVAPRLVLDVEDVLASGGSLHVELRFRAMSDFEPESVMEQVLPLRELLARRAKLANLRGCMNDALEDALQEIIHSPDSRERVASEVKAAAPAAGRLLDGIVAAGRLGRNLEERELGKEWLREFFCEWLAGRIPVSKDMESMLSGRIACMDQALSAQLTGIMHAPDFQRLEASWRGLEYLVSRASTSSPVRIRVLSVTMQELRRELQRAPEFDESAIFKKVYDDEYGIVGGEPFAVLAGDYYFGSGPEDVDLLERMSQIAAAAHAPFVAGASPSMFLLEDFTDLNRPRDIGRVFDTAFFAKWRLFRGSEDSKYAALVLPRMLLRRPYGEATLPVEAFHFEEFPDGGNRARYLWGNAAYAFAARLVNAFQSYGWCAAIRGEEAGGLVQGLPTQRLPGDDGDLEIECPLEIAITDHRAWELVTSGFIPLLHRKGTSMAVFQDAPSCHKPRVFDTEAATVAAIFSARLEYGMAVSRFAQYLKAILRDKIGVFLSAAECQEYLNNWIMGYVLPDAAGDDTRALYPLAYASVEVTESTGRPGRYRAVVFLTPQFQLCSLPAPLRLVTTLEARTGIAAQS